jgi:hypothetical protein
MASVQSAVDALERDGLIRVCNRGRNRIDGSALRILPGKVINSGHDTLKP